MQALLYVMFAIMYVSLTVSDVERMIRSYIAKCKVGYESAIRQYLERYLEKFKIADEKHVGFKVLQQLTVGEEIEVFRVAAALGVKQGDFRSALIDGHYAGLRMSEWFRVMTAMSKRDIERWANDMAIQNMTCGSIIVITGGEG